MVLDFIHSFFNATNPLGGKRINYHLRDTQELPALPDLSTYHSDISGFGTFKAKCDPRFPDTEPIGKQCFVNFAVYRQCLEEKSETQDPKDPNAAICRKYYGLTRRTCLKTELKMYEQQVQKDNWMWLVGLNQKKPGSNPSVLVLDGERNILKVLNQNEKDSRKFKVGDSVYDYKRYH